jgi:hypothetical protein
MVITITLSPRGFLLDFQQSEVTVQGCRALNVWENRSQYCGTESRDGIVCCLRVVLCVLRFCATYT